MKNRSDLVWATLGEGGLVLALAAIGWATHQPLIFASLGPTAYELVEQPQMPSARPYNVIVGHLIGLSAGFLALYLSNAWERQTCSQRASSLHSACGPQPYRLRSPPLYP